jgi:hypothetical protein
LRPSHVCFILRYSSNWNPHRLHSETFPPKEKHNVGPFASITNTTTLVSVLYRFEYLAERSNLGIRSLHVFSQISHVINILSDVIDVRCVFIFVTNVNSIDSFKNMYYKLINMYVYIEYFTSDKSPTELKMQPIIHLQNKPGHFPFPYPGLQMYCRLHFQFRRAHYHS